MVDPPVSPSIKDLHQELAEKSRQLSELDVILADYQAERDRLIVAVRTLQDRLRDLIEHSEAEGKSNLESQGG